MPRGPDKAFDKIEVLDLAMTEFWKHGYAATSISGLRNVTGLGAKSLYDTFGDKRTLFIACLEHYANKVLPVMFDQNVAKYPPKQALRKILEDLVKVSPRGETKGCLLGVAAAEVEDDPELSADINKYLVGIQRILEEVISNCHLKDSAPSPKALSSMLMTLLQGIHLISRVEGTEQQTKASIKSALQLIDTQMA
jgi:TetR/AcrR family transcriptional repressor of nem operon